MKLAANILWIAAMALLSVAAWALITEQGLWGHPHYRVTNVTTGIAAVLSLCASLLFPRKTSHQGVGRLGRWLGMEDPGSRKWATGSGVWVILVTGLAALAGGRFFDGSPANTMLGISVILLTLGGAFALHRFIARHGDEIGEARFDTRNKDESRP